MVHLPVEGLPRATPLGVEEHLVGVRVRARVRALVRIRVKVRPRPRAGARARARVESRSTAAQLPPRSWPRTCEA